VSLDWISVKSGTPENGKKYFVYLNEFGFPASVAIAIPFISSLHPDDPHWYLDPETYRLERYYEVAQTVTHYSEITTYPLVDIQESLF